MSDSTTHHKKCTKCDVVYPATLEYFHREKRAKDGLCSACKICLNEKSRQWRSLNPERQYEYGRKWAKEHPEKINKSTRRWQLRNPDKVRTTKNNRYHRLIGAEGTHTVADEEAQFKRQKGRCYYCDCTLTKTPFMPNSWHVDHVVPVTRGGRNSPDNIVIACAVCNRKKNNKQPHEWTEGGRLL